MPGLETPDTLLLLLVSGIIILAGLVHGTLGIGFPLMATPLLALLTDVRSAILLTLLPTAAVNVASILQARGWRAGIGRHWPMAVYAAGGALVGTHLLVISDPAPFKLLLAGAILAYLGISRLRVRPFDWIHSRPALAHAVFGLSAGLLAGLVNVMVPVLIAFALELALAPAVAIQVFNLCFLAGKLTQIGTFTALGVLELRPLLATLPLAAIALISLAAGIRLRAGIAAETYRTWLRRVLVVVALLLVAQFVGDSLA